MVEVEMDVEVEEEGSQIDSPLAVDRINLMAAVCDNVMERDQYMSK